jgi:RHS repeat-associated protein
MSEKLVSGSTTTWHDYLQIDGQIAAERFCTGAAPCGTGATMRYFVRDHLGSVAAVTDDTGTVVERDAYDAWGRRRNVNGSDDPACSLTSQTTRGYTGQEMMDAVCQVNANARVYDATLARFTSVDPLLNVYDGQNFNGYGYVRNNPLSMTDPTGMDDDDTGCPPVKQTPGISETVGVCGTRPNTGLTSDVPSIGVGGGIGNPPPHAISFHPLTPKPNDPQCRPWQLAPCKSNPLLDPAIKFVCKSSPGMRIFDGVAFGAGRGALFGVYFGFTAGEIFGGEVTLGASGIPGALLGGAVGGTVGAAQGLVSGIGLATTCYLAGAYSSS